ncbi:hypothetical protein L2K70_03800 [Nocardioides KLBMP 9356]|uniref:DUF559 domain-containing protein n=1 Tax=Nocardioides potassii TaxID=2911371 RepID=A0ABS9H9K8_9ACTN|nr:hypothetical protein [Nocardioides potassii]MCF6376718.1 hypothetical protein [Nocardioides potassii]
MATERGIHQHILEQGNRIRSYGAVTGWASLRFRGARFFDGSVFADDGVLAPVPIVTGPALLRADDRVVVTREQLAKDERELVCGVWTTVPARALFDEMRRHGRLRDAVADIEVAVAAGLLSYDEFSRYVASHNPWTGIGLARDAVALAGLGCWSRTEAKMALIWILDAELGRPLCNVPIFDLDGRLIAVVDLFEPLSGCAGEYQGADHKEGERHRQDVAREQRLRDAGIECFEVVGGDLSDVDLVSKRMHAARARALFREPGDRLWTLEQPDWWPAWAAARGL